MGILDDLDALDRRVFGEKGLRVIYKWIVPAFLVALAMAKAVATAFGSS